MKVSKTRMICEAAIFIAMAEILSLIKLYEFPNGGSITLEMLPIILFAARYGCGWGSLAGLVYGTITYLIGNKFSIDWTTIICDYFIAFVALGFGAGLAVFMFAGFVKNIPLEIEEAAMIDGCNPVQVFFKIVLPLSKAALTAIGLMFAVQYWNDYTNYKLYITNENLYNFQMKLRSLILGSDLPSAVGSATENTIKNAAVIVAILPFVIIYPFCQKYFISGVNIGAVKE